MHHFVFGDSLLTAAVPAVAQLDINSSLLSCAHDALFRNLFRVVGKAQRRVLYRVQGVV